MKNYLVGRKQTRLWRDLSQGEKLRVLINPDLNSVRGDGLRVIFEVE